MSWIPKNEEVFTYASVLFSSQRRPSDANLSFDRRTPEICGEPSSGDLLSVIDQPSETGTLTSRRASLSACGVGAFGGVGSMGVRPALRSGLFPCSPILDSRSRM